MAFFVVHAHLHIHIYIYICTSTYLVTWQLQWIYVSKTVDITTDCHLRFAEGCHLL